MRRQRHTADADELLVGVLRMLWRWRLELVLVLGLAGVQRLLAAPIGELGAGLVVAVASGGAIAIPRLRRLLTRQLRSARVRRAWHRAVVDVGLGSPFRLPRVTRVEAIAAGDRIRLRAPRGNSIADISARREELAACLRARDVRVLREPSSAAEGAVLVIRRDPLDVATLASWPNRDVMTLSLWDPIPLGIDEEGGVVTVHLPERNILVGGEPGAGKSAALSVLLATAALDPDACVWLLDGKLVELAAWGPISRRLAGPDAQEAIAVLREARAEMDNRYRELMARGRRKVQREDGLPLHLIVCDELAFYLSVPDRKERQEFTELLRDLVARGRAAGVIVCAATQKPGADVVPTALRDLFGFRLALRCSTPQASDTVLGQGWASAGADASTIPGGQRGVGYLLTEGERPVRIKGFYLDDADITAIVERASARRADAWFAKTGEDAAC
jgi:hypothetical protein